MFAKLKDFIVVCVHNKIPLAGSDLATLRQRIIASKAHYWEELEPGIFVAYFAIKRGGRTKSLKLTASLGILKKPGTTFYEMGIGRAIGELVTEANWYGKILTAPFGDAVNKAVKKAREEAEKSESGTEPAEDEES